MKRYLLDTSALLTLWDDEAGADQVAEILHQAESGKVKCFGCFISLMETFYRIWRDEDASSGRLAYEMCKSLPIEWIHESEELLVKAAELKAAQHLSLADAWIAASAIMAGATLVHKDPEFSALDIPQLTLPLKT